MNFCSNCGAEVKEGQAICLSCGFALKESAVKADPVPAKDYSNRVEHNVLKLWPNFTDGPIGRMEYFISLLKLTGIGLAVFFITEMTSTAVESAPIAAIPLGIFAIVSLVTLFIIVVQQVALIYKRFWDMGFEDNGTRVGMTIGYFIVSMIPILNLTVFAMFFVPGKGKVEA
jgi:uncharacterized membrane protein YhaH (DUF805 family)